MAGQSATLPISKATALAKGSGHDLGCNEGYGTKATAPTPGRDLGSGKKKMSHNY